MLSLKTLREESFLVSPRFWRLLAILGIPWLVCRCVTLNSPSVFTQQAFPSLLSVFTWHCPLWVCLLLTMTPATLDLGSTLLHYDLILTNYICKDFVSKKKKIQSWGFRKSVNFRGGEHYSTHYKRCTRKGGGLGDLQEWLQILPLSPGGWTVDCTESGL